MLFFKKIHSAFHTLSLCVQIQVAYSFFHITRRNHTVFSRRLAARTLSKTTSVMADQSDDVIEHLFPAGHVHIKHHKICWESHSRPITFVVWAHAVARYNMRSIRRSYVALLRVKALWCVPHCMWMFRLKAISPIGIGLPTLPFRGLSVCLSVRLVHCAPTAEDIDTFTFAYTTASSR